MGLLEDNVLEHGNGIDVLLLDATIGLLALTDNDTGGLWLEEDAAGGDGLGTTVLEFGDTDGAEADLEDADAIKLDLLAEFEEVLEGFAQFLQHGFDVALLDGGLTLDEVGQLLGADEVVVVNGHGIILAEGSTLFVLVL